MYCKFLYSFAGDEQNSISRLKSPSKFKTGESDRSLNSPPAVGSTVLETAGKFPVFLQDSSPKLSDLIVSKPICNEIKCFSAKKFYVQKRS